MSLTSNRVIVVTGASRGVGRGIAVALGKFGATIAKYREQYAPFVARAASPESTGLVIDTLMRDPNLMRCSGKTWIEAEIAVEFGIVDIDGKQPASDREFLGEPARASGVAVG